VHTTGSVGRVVGLLVFAAGHIEAKDASAPASLVVAGEQGHDDEPLHGGGKIGPHHLRELVRLALE